MNELFIPNARKVEDARADIYVLEDFLSPGECQHLIHLIRSQRRPAELTNKDEPDKDFRTNWSADLEDLSDPEAIYIDTRMSRLLGFDASHSEFMQGQQYLKGQQFKAHTDYFKGVDLAKYAEGLGQRTYTFLVYLNDDSTGGETNFPLLKLSFPPKQGCALIWNNLAKDGSLNEMTLHQGLPVLYGEKFIVTKWFRSNVLPPKHIKERSEYIPAYNKIGIKKTRIPTLIYHELCAFYHSNIQSQKLEVGSEHLIHAAETAVGSEMIELPETLRVRVHNVLRPLAEEWAGVPLKATYVYGVRIYRRSAMLIPHRDRPNTHIVGVLLNLDQDVDEDWPLVIDDHNYREYHVTLRPGEMLFYEGAKLRHGRPYPLRGTRYANVFCHFVPVSWLPEFVP